MPFVGLAPVRLLHPSVAVLYHVNSKLQRAYFTNKNHSLKINGNLIDIMFDWWDNFSESYRMTNHRPQTKNVTSEKIVSVFPPFTVRFH